MRRVIISITSALVLSGLLTASVSFAQETHLRERRIAEAKDEFKKQMKADTANYSKSVKMFEQLVKEDPRDAELRYFFGYALDKMNADDATKMVNIDLPLLTRTSEQFEEVIRLQPVYKGETVSLDPYSKIGSIWGSAGMAYLEKAKPDSARWAFVQGKNRGGFIEPVLEYTRQLMSSCDSNAMLITYGDNSFFPSVYLQVAEQFRSDIVMLDANLLGTGWYGKFLKKSGRIKMGYSMTDLDTLEYQRWEPRQIMVTDPWKRQKELSWVLLPTYMEKYVLKADLVLLDILKHNFFEKSLYFPLGTDSSFNLFLQDYFVQEGLLNKVVSDIKDDNRSEKQCLQNLKSYTIGKMNSADILKSNDAIILLNGFRYAYYTKMYEYVNRGEKERAKQLAEEMVRKFSKSKLPFDREEMEAALTEYLDFLQVERE